MEEEGAYLPVRMTNGNYIVTASIIFINIIIIIAVYCNYIIESIISVSVVMLLAKLLLRIIINTLDYLGHESGIMVLIINQNRM